MTCKACDVKQPAIKGRAETYEQKRAVMEKILAAWTAVPHLRLGQLLENSVNSMHSTFYVEDEVLAEKVEEFVNSHGLSRPSHCAGDAQADPVLLLVHSSGAAFGFAHDDCCTDCQ